MRSDKYDVLCSALMGAMCGLAIGAALFGTVAVRSAAQASESAPVAAAALPEPVQEHHPITVMPDYESLGESELIARAVIATIGTEREESCFGFSATYVLQVLTAEAGYDEELARGIAQCICNTTNKLQSRYTPVEVCRMYRYADPVSWYSDAAYNAFCDIMVRGEVCEAVEDATVFYNPIYGYSEYHESCELVTEINGVRFFREVD